ncbi:MAG TPA: hypothetical protein VGN75_01225 [Kaistia sp.]|jgi:SOS-response transcriptional repressor LexA|nr:hypothetical protein [Kaistia sp.]
MITAPAVAADAPLPLTRKQLAALRVIVEWHDTYSVVPSYNEIGCEMDLVSRSSVHRVVTELVDKRWLRRHPGRARCLQVLHRPPMPDFEELEFLPSAEILPEHLAHELAAAAARYDGEAAPCG